MERYYSPVSPSYNNSPDETAFSRSYGGQSPRNKYRVHANNHHHSRKEKYMKIALIVGTVLLAAFAVLYTWARFTTFTDDDLNNNQYIKPLVPLIEWSKKPEGLAIFVILWVTVGVAAFTPLGLNLYEKCKH